MAAGAASLPWSGGCRASTCSAPGEQVVLVDAVHDPQRLRGRLVARGRNEVLLAHRLLRLSAAQPRRVRCRLSTLASERDVSSRRGRHAAPGPNPLTRPFGSDPPSLSKANPMHGGRNALAHRTATRRTVLETRRPAALVTLALSSGSTSSGFAVSFDSFFDSVAAVSSLLPAQPMENLRRNPRNDAREREAG